MALTPHVLVVGGVDSSGGAGVVRDIETITRHGLRACLAVTAITVQTDDDVGAIRLSPPNLVAEQMRAALQANPAAAVKVGMLGTAYIIDAVAGVLRDHPHLPVVLDPVLASTSGRALLQPDAIAVMQAELMQLCNLITPNLIELAQLTGAQPARDDEGAMTQGLDLMAAGAQSVLIKGGHASGPRSTDILLRRDGEPMRLDAPRLSASMRGTGCMLASAIAANLAQAMPLEASIHAAKLYVFHMLEAPSRPGGRSVRHLLLNLAP